MRMLGNKRICGTDLNNYMSLASKWKNNKNLKDWWRTRSADEKVDWYRSEQTHTAGAKRDFSWITFTETNRQEHNVRVSRSTITFASPSTFVPSFVKVYLVTLRFGSRIFS